jgi:thioredoxin-related protein
MFAGTVHAIAWLYDLRIALDRAGKEGKPVLVDFYTDRCGWCKKMDLDTYGDRSVNAIASDFICVKVDGARQRGLVKKYNIRAYPTTLFLNDKGAVIQRARGYIGPGRFNKIMRSVLAEYSPRVKKGKKIEKARKSPFKLSGIFHSGQAPKAIINNTMVGVGDTVSGAKVVKISEIEVTLSYRGQEIKLEVE